MRYVVLFQGTGGTRYVVIYLAAFVLVMLILILLVRGIASLWHRMRLRR